MRDVRFRRAVLLLAIAAALPYVGMFRNGWTYYDDYAITQDRPSVTTISCDSLRQIWTPRGNYVPVRDTLYFVDHALFGSRIIGYQLTSLVGHVVGVLAFFVFVRRHWNDHATGVLAAILFAVHPLHTEAVAWVAGSKDVFCFAFSVLASLSYQRRVQSSAHAWAYAALCGVFLILALGSKLAALALPLVFAGLELTDAQARTVPLAVRLRRWVPFACITAVWLVLALGPARRAFFDFVGIAVAPPADGSAEGFAAAADLQRVERYWDTLRAMVVVSWRYVGLWLWPVGLSPIYFVELYATWFASPVLLGTLGLIVGLLGGGALYRWRHYRVAFWLVWAVAFYLPVSNLLPIAALMNDRYVHIPSAAGAVLVAAGLTHLTRRSGSRGRLARVATVSLVLCLAVLTVRQVAVWRGPRTLWEHAAREQPDSTRIRITLAGLLLLEGRPADGATQLRALESAAPDDYRRLLLLGKAYLLSDRPGIAVRVFDEALDLYPNDTVLELNRGAALGAMGRHEEALTVAGRILGRVPAHIEARVLEGLALAKLGRAEEAAAAFGAAAVLAPNRSATYREAALALRDVAPRAALPFARDWYELTESPDAAGVLVNALEAGAPLSASEQAELRRLRARWGTAVEGT